MSKVDQLLSKEMTRRQFLTTLGFGFISLFGFSSLIGALTDSANSGSDNGYGIGGYGR